MISQPLSTIDELRREVVRLRTLLNRDHTGLAAALADVVREASARLWVVDGRGSYEWDDVRYRREVGLALRAVIEVARTALGESGKLADSAFHPERGTVPEPTMATSAAIRLRELIRELGTSIETLLPYSETQWLEVEKLARGGMTRVDPHCTLGHHEACTGNHCCCQCHTTNETIKP